MRTRLALAALTTSACIALLPAVATAKPIISKVTLSERAPYWHGEVFSEKFGGIRKCERDRHVRVFKRLDGKDQRIGSDTSSRSGRWSLPHKPTKGIYYARVTERRGGDGPACAADTSGIVVID